MIFDKLYIGDDKGLEINHTGTSHITTPSHNFILSNTLQVPKISKPLILFHKFCIDNNCYFEFWPYYFLIKDHES